MSSVPRRYRVRPLSKSVVDATRRDARRLAVELSVPLRSIAQPLAPPRAFAALFGVAPDEAAVTVVRRAYAAAMNTRTADTPGYVYVFRDRRDAPTVFKIGRTRSTPTERLAEWRAELGTDTLTLCFAYPTARCALAERVAHVLLGAWRLPALVNPATHRLVTEYFAIERLDALKAFVDAVTRHVTWFDAVVIGGNERFNEFSDPATATALARRQYRRRRRRSQ